ncbi:hypothetical protein HYS91_02685 [Candidatus Daviesbacteria bacterium]|nr:hypothetical protein [Candidatus Daviesbacteria bacterium]
MAGLESVERKNGRRGFIVRTGLFIVGGLTALATRVGLKTKPLIPLLL